ncbi:tetratricopeptide repeat protein [Streptomyces sp. NPDC042319]|uniref:tetratricopeptide repeat protein n=1 Tax=Streptomyces sp. NPDC042319 TaxID=3154332 RepID=UPI0033CEE2DC
MIVLDDVPYPAMLNGLWPPDVPYGRTVVTTRNRDAAFTGNSHHHIGIDLFTDTEATRYLAAKLAAHHRYDDPHQVQGLAGDLGRLPLALAQAVPYMVNKHLDCAAYRRRLADHRRTLPSLLADSTGLPDDQRHTVAAAWSLSIELADQLPPSGLATSMLQLTAMLDPNGIPTTVLSSPPALAHLASHRPRPVTPAAPHGLEDDASVSVEDATDALANLRQLSLIDYTPDASRPAVRVHQLIQRGTRDALTGQERDQLARTAADALIAAWPAADRDTVLAEELRANAVALTHHAEAALYRLDIHPVLFRTGTSLGRTGQVSAAITHYRHMADAASQHLGPDHPAALTARANLVRWQGKAGDVTGAATATEELLTDSERALGPEHPHTLATRANLVRWQGEAGDVAGAAAATEELLADSERVLGPNHPDVLTARHNMAALRGEAGDAVGAAAAFEMLLADRLEVLGPDHPDTLTTRHNHAFWQGKARNADEAVAGIAELLPDSERLLGPYHPHTLTARANLAYWCGKAGDISRAASAFEELLPDCVRVLGPDHPHTLTVQANLAYWRRKTGSTLRVSPRIPELEHPYPWEDRVVLGQLVRLGEPLNGRGVQNRSVERV